MPQAGGDFRLAVCMSAAIVTDSYLLSIGIFTCGNASSASCFESNAQNCPTVSMLPFESKERIENLRGPCGGCSLVMKKEPSMISDSMHVPVGAICGIDQCLCSFHNWFACHFPACVTDSNRFTKDCNNKFATLRNFLLTPNAGLLKWLYGKAEKLKEWR